MGGKMWGPDGKEYDTKFIIPDSTIGSSADFLLEGATAQVLFFEGEPVSIELPNNVVFEIDYTEPGYKGNTVTKPCNIFLVEIRTNITTRIMGSLTQMGKGLRWPGSARWADM